MTACPNCGGVAWRDEVDVEVGIIYGPYGCSCGWSEWDVYDQTNGPTATSGKRTDQWGSLYPTDPAAPEARDSDEHSHGPWQCHDCWELPIGPIGPSIRQDAYPNEPGA